MADLTKTEEKEVEKSLGEEVERTSHASETDSGVNLEGNSSTSGTAHSTENEKKLASGDQGSGLKRNIADVEDEPPKKVPVSIVQFNRMSV